MIYLKRFIFVSCGVLIAIASGYGFHHCITQIVTDDYEKYTVEIGRSMSKAVTSDGVFQTLANAIENGLVINQSCFEKLAQSVSKIYTSSIIYVETHSVNNVIYSYPKNNESIVFLPDQEAVINSMISRGHIRIMSYNDLFFYETNPNIGYVSCLPVRTNGQITSFIGVGIIVEDLLSSETGLPSILVDTDIDIDVGEKNGWNTVNIFSSCIFDTFKEYMEEITPGYFVIVKFSEPFIPHKWVPYVIVSIIIVLFIVAILIESNYDKKNSLYEKKTMFLANVSHEIRTPMNGIIGMSDILRQEKNLSKNCRECIEVISTSSNYLLRIVNNVLDLSKAEAKMIDIRVSEISTSIFRETAIDMWKMCKKNDNVKMSIVYKNIPIDSKIYGDMFKITQVISNLITNAIKFTNSGSITMIVEWCMINSLDLSRNSVVEIKISVNDTGIGIPAKGMNSLFKPFQQMGNNLTGQGTGIGLTVSKSFAVAMGGDLTCISDENSGSRFTFNFKAGGKFRESHSEVFVGEVLLKSDIENPIILDKVDKVDKVGKVDKVDKVGNVDKVDKVDKVGNVGNVCKVDKVGKALVVDDTKINVMVLGKMLNKHGIEHDTAYDGLDAVKLCMEKKYDIIFMDKFMKVMHGPESVLNIRKNGLNTDTAIVFVTADTSSSARQECLLSGGNDFITKPVNCAKLANILSMYNIIS